MMWDMIDRREFERNGTGSVIFDQIYMLDAPAEKFSQKMKEISTILDTIVKENPDFDFSVESRVGGSVRLSWKKKKEKYWG